MFCLSFFSFSFESFVVLNSLLSLFFLERYARYASPLLFLTGQFIIVQKSKVIYPHIWWAHPWPFPEDMEKDGIFLEVHTNPRYEDRDRQREISSNPEKNASSSTNMKHGTWFIVRFLYFETGSLQVSILLPYLPLVFTLSSLLILFYLNPNRTKTVIAVISVM